MRHGTTRRYDVAIIGGGLIGLATAYRLLEARPGLRLAVLEKEPELARHQSGRNSGVIHAGLYYTPGSLKARLCREGMEAVKRFADERGIPYELCGKLVVALDESELAPLAELSGAGSPTASGGSRTSRRTGSASSSSTRPAFAVSTCPRLGSSTSVASRSLTPAKCRLAGATSCSGVLS